MAGVLGDRGREIEGDINAYEGSGSGAFAKTQEALDHQVGGWTSYSLSFKASRVAPTGATYAPRSWGALASVYLGQPSA